jgi:hypothetical protein
LPKKFASAKTYNSPTIKVNQTLMTLVEKINEWRKVEVVNSIGAEAYQSTESEKRFRELVER